MYSCKQATLLKNESFHRPLSLMERLGLRFHFLICAGCEQMSRQLEFIHKASTRLLDETKSSEQPTLSADARERIRTALKENQQDSELS